MYNNVSELPSLRDLHKELNPPVDLGADNPWNLPDWKDIEAYPSVKGTSSMQWRWEFLRRDKLYRDRWLEYQPNIALWDEVQPDGESNHERVAKSFNIPYLFSPRRSFDFFVNLGMMHAKPFGIWNGAVSVEKFSRDALSKGHCVLSVDPTLNRKEIWEEVDKQINNLYRGPNPCNPNPDPHFSFAALSSEQRRYIVRTLEIVNAGGSTNKVPSGRLPRDEPSYYPEFLQILDARREFDQDTKKKQWKHMITDLVLTKKDEVLDYSAAGRRLKSALKIQNEFIHEYGKRY